VPTIVLGIVAFVELSDKPNDATWLTAEQKTWLNAKLEGERRRASKVAPMSVWKVMTNKTVLIMALVYAGAAGASTSLALWMPQLVKSFGLTNFQTGLVNAVPFGIAAVAATRDRPLRSFSVRKEAKDHGVTGRLAGALLPGDKVVITEDTVTRGTSIMEAVDVVEAAGAEPVAILVIVDRGGTCGAMAAARGIPFLPLLTAEDLGFGFGT
jgi:orotate phosphoribosyltransferase